MIIILFFLILIFPASRVYAADIQQEPVKVGYYENEVFEEGADEGAVKTGYAYEYYRKLSEYTGWRYEYVYGSFTDLYESLLNGDVDLMAGLAIREDRIGKIGYPQMAMGSEIYILVKHEADDSISADTKTLSGKRIGVLKSAIADLLDEYLLAHDVNAEVIVFEDYESLFDAFDLGNIEILAAEGDGAYGREHAEVIGSFGSSDYYLCVSKNRKDLLEELDNAQSELNADEPNYISSLRSKYYSASVQSRTFSAAEREWMASHDSMTVGYLNHYLPYSDTDSEGNVEGIVKDILPDILKSLKVGGVGISYVGYEKYDDMIEDAATGKIDVAFPVGGGLYYSEESGINQSGAVASTSTDLVYAGEYSDDVTDHFAVNENNRMQYYYITTNFPDAKINLYPSIDKCLEAVLSGEVSATTLNGLRANDILKNSKYNGLYLRQLGVSDDRCFGVRIGNEGLLKLLNRGINVLGTDYIQNIAYRYAGELYNYSFSDMMRDHIWIFTVMIFFIALLVILLVVRELNHSKRSNKLKSDFVSNMSHEIRTPITAILGMNEMIRRDSIDEEILRYSDNIEKAGESLLGIINDILDFSKIEAGRMELYKEEYNLVNLLSQLEVMVRYRTEEKGLAFDMDIDKTLPLMPVGDEQKLRQIMTNLLTNAVKYTEKGSIKLTVRLVNISSDTVEMEILVEDTGIGIQNEEIDKLFSAFDRLDLEKTRNIEGSGLGLTITKHLLELMGSSISVKSEYGKGSCFFFRLTQGVYDATPIGDYKKASLKPAKTGRMSVTSSFKAPSARILIVDDTPMNLQVISGLLKNNGMRIDTAGSGEECLKLLGINNYDLVFLDQRMPHMDGVDTLRELKKKYPDKLKTTPVVCLTANVLSGAREKMIKAGFTDYLTKPVNLKDLEEMLKKHLPEDKIIINTENDSSAGTASYDLTPVKDTGLFDIEEGIEYCGDEEDYVDALKTYASSVSEKKELIKKQIGSGDKGSLALTVHSLKSMSKAVGAYEIAKQAAELEDMARDGNKEVPVDKIEEFLNLYSHTVERLDAALKDMGKGV